MPMLDDAMFDPATFARPGMLEQFFGTPLRGGAPPPGWAPGMAPPMDVPPLPMPPPPMSSGDGGAMMPVPAMPQSMPPAPDMAALSGAYGSDREPPKTDVGETSMLGRIGSGIGDFLKGADQWRKDNRSTLMALGAGMAGSQSLGQGLSRGMHLALPAQQADLAQQKQNQTAKWLVEKKGMSPQEAEALVNNPEMMKQVLPQLMGAKQLQHVTIKGTMGEDIPLTFDPVSGKYARADIAGGGNFGGAVSSIEDVPKEIRGRVQAVLDGREAPPPGGSRSPQAQAILNYAGQVEPGFDFTKWMTRSQTAKDFASGGKSGLAIKSAEQGLHHVGELMKSIDALPDSGSPVVNWIWNEGKKHVVGNPAYRDVMTNAHAVADEFSALWKGAGHSSDAEIRSWEANLDPNMTRAEWHGQVNKLMGLLGGSLDALETSRTRGMATTKELPPILSEKGRATIERAGQWARGMPAGTPSAPATAGSSAASAVPVHVKTPDEARKLPRGTHIILPDGTPGVVP